MNHESLLNVIFQLAVIMLSVVFVLNVLGAV